MPPSVEQLQTQLKCRIVQEIASKTVPLEVKKGVKHHPGENGSDIFHKFCLAYRI